MVRRAARLVRNFGILVLFLVAALAGTASGVIFASVDDLPQIAALDDYSLGKFTKVLGRDGSVVAEYAAEGSRRQIVTYEQIPDVLKQAIISSEDADFFHHGGLNLQRIVVTALKRVLRLQRAGGASTLTQQLARDLFLTKEYSWERKIKEALLALQIEKRYTKNEIFALYCNKMYWGDHAYGVEAASQLLFAKHVQDLNLDEAALIAGMLQGNQAQSPYHHPEAALARRNTVLSRMAAEGYITKTAADAARKRPIVTFGQPKADPSIAPYFKEWLRIYLEERYGQKAIDTGGMVVRTGLDPALQRAANAALDSQLRMLDKARGFRARSPKDNIEKAGKSVDTYSNGQWTHDPVVGEIVPTIVTAIEGHIVRVRLGRWRGAIYPEGYAWTNKTRADDIARRGDVIDVKIQKVDATGTTFTAALDQEPTLEGAVVAIDNHTGQVLAMIGGRRFSEKDMFNRAVSAQRQVGSLFKPFVFTAAIDSGMTAADTIKDEPVEFLPGPNQPIYAPQNYEAEAFGDMTLREVLEHSANRPTVKLMYLLTPEKVIPYARALGLTTPLPPYLSTAIGSAESTLMEMASAYSAFPNQGVRMEPVPVLNVTDRDGNVLEENYPEPHDAIKADTAAVITSMMQGVVDRGTGKNTRLKITDWPLGGKTGTTDDFTDAWFIGFDPDITIGVWVGYNTKKTIGEHMSGATVALPIWADIMKSWVDRRRAELPETPVFLRPGNVVELPSPKGPKGFEVFIAGTAPGKPVIEK
jgi:penicillin-binding protein 1A